MACSTPHSLLTRQVLEQSVKNDMGPRWNLVNYEIKDFIKTGDNFQTCITGILCKARTNGEEKSRLYVAKLNPLRDTASRVELLEELFMRETTFLSKVSLKINEILKSLNCEPVTFPEIVYFDLSLGREIMITRDLRQQGFRMVDKTIGLGTEHSTLVLQGLARLHASSIVFKNQLGTDKILELYPCFLDKFLQPGAPIIDVFVPMFSNLMDVILETAECIEGYDKAKTWIKTIKDESFLMYAEQIKQCPSNMRVICQGDCWYNNLLFRYTAQGLPEDVAFLDLQYPRFASLGLDLNNFIFSSVAGNLRKNNYHHLLSIYFSEFERVIKNANIDLPFTKEEFKKEVEEKIVFGIVLGLFIFTLALNDDDEILDSSSGNKLTEQMSKYVTNAAKMLNVNPFLKPKLVALLDDISDQILKNREK